MLCFLTGMRERFLASSSKLNCTKRLQQPVGWRSNSCDLGFGCNDALAEPAMKASTMTSSSSSSEPDVVDEVDKYVIEQLLSDSCTVLGSACQEEEPFSTEESEAEDFVLASGPTFNPPIPPGFDYEEPGDSHCDAAIVPASHQPGLGGGTSEEAANIMREKVQDSREPYVCTLSIEIYREESKTQTSKTTEEKYTSYVVSFV